MEYEMNMVYVLKEACEKFIKKFQPWKEVIILLA
jgi:hypothetical protein